MENPVVTRIDEHTWRIDEPAVRFFLLEGSEYALLVDTGKVTENAKEIAESLTDKPIRLLNTHADLDHIRSNYEFDEFYLHPAEACNYYKRNKGHGRFIPLADKQIIDPGDRPLEVVTLSGHTPGSVTFRDSLTGDLFTGDNVTPMVTLHFPRGETVQTWLDGAKRTLALAGESRLHVGHGNDAMPKEWLAAVIGWAEELVLKGNGNSRKARTVRGEKKFPCLVYRQNRVTGASRAKEQKR